MKKRAFLEIVATGTVGIAGTALLAGCMAPRVGKRAGIKTEGEPYRCERCGHLTRSKTDITGERCPRCRARMLKRITEEEMAQYLAKESTAK